MKITRRGLLIGGAAGGGLLLAWTLTPRSFDNPLSPGDEEVAFDAWLKIAADGVVTVAVPQLEMGQGVTTILPQIIAQEMGADWRQIAVEPAPVSGAYSNLPLATRWAPLWRPLMPELADEPDDLLLERWAQDKRFTATAEGMSVAAYEMPCREAGASARALLAMAAGYRWNVAWEECSVENGIVSHEDKSASFAELALESAQFDPPDPPVLRARDLSEISPFAAAEREGEPVAFPRLDLPSKVDGSHIFAGDVRLPGMVYAAIRHGPLDKSELLDFDAEAAQGQRGILQYVRGKRWLAAVADNWWAAEEALKKIAPKFAVHRPARSEEMGQALEEGARAGAATRVAFIGEGRTDYKPEFAQRYEVMPAVHATIETTSVTARLADDLLELWLPAQAPELAREAAAKALGMSVSRVILYPVSAGGSFDRRLDHSAVIEAALIAREVGRPVQLIWSRWQEQARLYPRMPAVGMVGALIDGAGDITAMRTRLASPPAMLEFGRRLFANDTNWSAIDGAQGEADPMACEGLLAPYDIPDQAAQHIPVKIDLPCGPMRGGAHGITCFMRESFIDEIISKYRLEPLSYRITRLTKDIRLADCLQRAARSAQWDGGAAGTGQGMACHVMRSLGGVDAEGENQFATGRIAIVASASAGEGGVRVSRIDACVDIGRVINRDIALQQIEGGLIFGLGLALGCGTRYEDGLPVLGRLSSLGVPSLADTPEINVELVASDNPPFDPGEIGVPAIAPAIANAFFSATGIRLRQLPLLSGEA